MGGLNPFAKPKVPEPVVVTPPPTVAPVDDTKLTDERKRRALATGTSGNIQSSLSTASSDLATTSRKTLLGG